MFPSVDVMLLKLRGDWLLLEDPEVQGRDSSRAVHRTVAEKLHLLLICFRFDPQPQPLVRAMLSFIRKTLFGIANHSRLTPD